MVAASVAEDRRWLFMRGGAGRRPQESSTVKQASVGAQHRVSKISCLLRKVVVDKGLSAQRLHDLLYGGVSIAIAVEQGFGDAENALALLVRTGQWAGAGGRAPQAQPAFSVFLVVAGMRVCVCRIRYTNGWHCSYRQVYIDKTPRQQIALKAIPENTRKVAPLFGLCRRRRETTMAESGNPHSCMGPCAANARQHPSAMPISGTGQHISWRQVDEASDARGRAHLQQLGVKPGEPVALFANNCRSTSLRATRCRRSLPSSVLRAALNKAHELEYQLNDLQARVIIAADIAAYVVDKVRGGTAAAACAGRALRRLAARQSHCLPVELRPIPTAARQCDVVLGSHAQRRQAFTCRWTWTRWRLMTYTSGHHGPCPGRHAEF